MEELDARKVPYQIVYVLGLPMLYTPNRLDRSTVPDRMHAYDIREDSEFAGRPVQIKEHVLVNFFGSVLSASPLALNEDGYLLIESENDFFFTDVDGLYIGG